MLPEDNCKERESDNPLEAGSSLMNPKRARVRKERKKEELNKTHLKTRS